MWRGENSEASDSDGSSSNWVVVKEVVVRWSRKWWYGSYRSVNKRNGSKGSSSEEFWIERFDCEWIVYDYIYIYIYYRISMSITMNQLIIQIM